MTLDNLLTMSGGFEWQGGMLESPSLDQLASSGDWVQFMLGLPLSDPPGSRFVYNSGGSHLLSAIVQQTTGMMSEKFAAANLFAPLGITAWAWNSDPNMISTGGWGLWLAPRDMAKFGYLYLHGGAWDSQQVVPAEWVADSTRAHITAGSQWLSDDYGYQWWIDQEGYYMALGYGGQYIIVMPERDMVVTFTSGLSVNDYFVPEELFNSFILPASESSEPLPANPEGNAALQTAIDALEQPAAEAVPPLSDTAQAISGQTYTFEENELSVHSLSLTFSGGAEAQLTLDGLYTFPIGLDGVLRSVDEGGPMLFGLPTSLRGKWRTGDDFVFEIHLLGTSANYTITLKFEDTHLKLFWRENVGGQSGSFQGTRAAS
jgi:hypothetical protein